MMGVDWCRSFARKGGDRAGRNAIRTLLYGLVFLSWATLAQSDDKPLVDEELEIWKELMLKTKFEGWKYCSSTAVKNNPCECKKKNTDGNIAIHCEEVWKGDSVYRRIEKLILPNNNLNGQVPLSVLRLEALKEVNFVENGLCAESEEIFTGCVGLNCKWPTPFLLCEFTSRDLNNGTNGTDQGLPQGGSDSTTGERVIAALMIVLLVVPIIFVVVCLIRDENGSKERNFNEEDRVEARKPKWAWLAQNTITSNRDRVDSMEEYISNAMSSRSSTAAESAAELVMLRTPPPSSSNGSPTNTNGRENGFRHQSSMDVI